MRGDIKSITFTIDPEDKATSGGLSFANGTSFLFVLSILFLLLMVFLLLIGELKIVYGMSDVKVANVWGCGFAIETYFKLRELRQCPSPFTYFLLLFLL